MKKNNYPSQNQYTVEKAMELNYFSKKLKPYVCTTDISLLIRYAGQDNLVKNLMEIVNKSYSFPTQIIY